MIRKVASALFALALLIALDFAIAHTQTDIGAKSTAFSAPCEPAAPALRATVDAHAVSPYTMVGAATGDRALPGPAAASRDESLPLEFPPPGPQSFPALRHRPPPSHS